MAEAYRKVLTGGLRFKGDASTKKRSGGGAVDRAHALERGPGFKAKTVKPESGVHVVPAGAVPPVPSSSGVVPASAGRSWHKDELHEIDANLAALREQDRTLSVVEAGTRREAVEREKKLIESQIALRKQDPATAAGKTSDFNRASLFRRETSVSDATTRLDSRAKKKADRYCK